MTELTILVPVYNEEESLKLFKTAMDEYLDKTSVPSEVLFINDGSTDASYLLLKRIIRSDERYSMMSLKENRGLSTALKAGIDQVKSRWVGYIDADLQTSPMDFLKYIEYMPDNDMITGIREKRIDSPVKRLTSLIANRVRSRLVGDGILDSCCPLKIMKTSAAQEIPFFKGMHRFLPALIMLQGGKVHQLKVRHFQRTAGTSKFNLANRFVGILDMFAFIWIKKRHIDYTIVEKEMVTSYKKEVQRL